MSVVDVSLLSLEISEKVFQGQVLVLHHLGVHQVQHVLLQLWITIQLEHFFF